MTVVSASNTSGARRGPATVIVTRDDIGNGGYTELSQILDDLLGMQVVRALYGATYLKNYWRGFRNTIGGSLPPPPRRPC